ncbi:N-acetylglucosaminyldiphosphoundecaprenol N-acetyl-beta-D-mannosaminyltransferase [Paraburkholderia ultramafica]|uniref:N-acetylglucosaminyldiphosphoundecaprenol N-acetyl-beta-D-mannosaminyltransferase n=1 Tax=Paraburkholderia ultramafica TaxID=1544867 RepID=A0A6S7AT68_9BURK|nr:WecB/TagA/CpsF family glycosyltransferase [Paraburkholderia ultramafica]CAB3777078.1 N-acetylglucosaminyldiphosphoundecaprenol N-acetyl-beta-D-mannosaminyltransferase [Paraburkholderia ultramafica]
MKRIEVFGCPIDAATMDETVAAISSRIIAKQFTQHGAVNVAKLVHMQSNTELAQSVGSCDLINVDGMGVVWAARVLGNAVPERVAGIDLFDRLLAEAARLALPVYLLGATDEVVSRVATICANRYSGLQIAGYHHGYFGDDHQPVVDRIRESGARLLFVAITSPTKENFINRWKAALGVDFVMGVGGTFDVMAGNVRRAPCWMQRVGLEWLFRVLQEPRRMWRRYLITNSKFALMVGKALIVQR